MEDEDYFHFIIAECTPIDAAQIRKELRKDKTLSKIYLYARDGWPKETSKDVKEFANKADEISIKSELLMWVNTCLLNAHTHAHIEPDTCHIHVVDPG